MFTQRRNLCKAFLSAVAVQLLLTTAGQCAALTTVNQTTATPVLSNGSLTAQPKNSSAEAPVLLPLHRPCGSEHENYCENGGECMFPQDSDKPSCICKSSFSGPRCLFFIEDTSSPPEAERMIGITFAIVMILIALAIVIYCFAQKRCVKSTPLIKSAPSETSV